MLVEYRQKEKEIESLRSKLLSSQSADLLEGVKEIGGTRLLVRQVEADSPKALRDFADSIKERLGSGLIVLGARQDQKAMLLCLVTQDLLGRYKAGQIVSRLSSIVGGKGGGRDDMAQGGGTVPRTWRLPLKRLKKSFPDRGEPTLFLGLFLAAPRG